MRGGVEDHIDHIIAQWKRERPDLDVSPMAVIARMSRLSRLLERSIAEVLARYGINEPQFGVLAALRRAGPPFRLSPTALYNSLLISSGAMTNRLERLRAAGLVRRIPDPRDGRSVLVALTRKGHRVVDQAVTAHIENEHRLLACLSGEERSQLASLLRKLLIAVEGEAPVPRGRGRTRVGPVRGPGAGTGGDGQGRGARGARVGA
jgi:DNA-binding MarR family transcriptional regulator